MLTLKLPKPPFKILTREYIIKRVFTTCRLSTCRCWNYNHAPDLLLLRDSLKTKSKFICRWVQFFWILLIFNEFSAGIVQFTVSISHLNTSWRVFEYTNLKYCYNVCIVVKSKYISFKNYVSLRSVNTLLLCKYQFA